jgi:hypothetical protein
MMIDMGGRRSIVFRARMCIYIFGLCRGRRAPGLHEVEERWG